MLVDLAADQKVTKNPTVKPVRAGLNVPVMLVPLKKGEAQAK